MSKELTEQELEDVKQIVCDEVDAISDVLLEASHAIHANPELNLRNISLTKHLQESLMIKG